MDPLSDQNPLIKQIRRAAQRGTLTDDGYAIAEGPHVIDEVIKAGCDVRAVIIAESSRIQQFDGARTVLDKTFRTLASTETPQGVIALVKPPSWSAEQIVKGNALAIVLDGIQEPGNAGAIVRTAEAFGATGVVFLKGTVNPYNPKCIRASAGSIFRVPIATEADLSGVALYAAMPNAEKRLNQADFTCPCAIVIGSEGHGVSPDLCARAIGVRISTSGVESLNAAVAAGVILYEARRQRNAS